MEPNRSRSPLLQVGLVLLSGSLVLGAGCAVFAITISPAFAHTSDTTGRAELATDVEPTNVPPVAPTPESSALLPAVGEAVDPQYPVNASGLTYGSGALAASYADLPDLSLVRTNQGRNAYVFTRELDSDDGSVFGGTGVDPHEKRTLAAYESDGKTRAGTYTVGGP